MKENINSDEDIINVPYFKKEKYVSKKSENSSDNE